MDVGRVLGARAPAALLQGPRGGGPGKVDDGVADNDTVIQNEADIQKKREVYALKTALRSANGLARYLQIPPMKETTSGSDKKQTHERLRKEARRKRDLVLEMSKKTILDAYKEMTTKADETKKQEELKGKDVDVVTNEKTREDLEIAERASRAREPNRTTKEKPAPATKNKPAVAVAARKTKTSKRERRCRFRRRESLDERLRTTHNAADPYLARYEVTP